MIICQALVVGCSPHRGSGEDASRGSEIVPRDPRRRMGRVTAHAREA